MSGEGVKVETPAETVMFPATPGYGKLIKGSVGSAIKAPLSRRPPVPGDSISGSLSGFRRTPLNVDMEPILKMNAVVGYTCVVSVVEGHASTAIHTFNIVPVSAYKSSHTISLKPMRSPDPSKPLPFVPENRYFIHYESFYDTGSLVPMGGTRTLPYQGHPTFSILTDNVGNKIHIRTVDETLYWPIDSEQRQLPDIIVDDIKSGFDGAVEASVLERVNERVAAQDARIRELEAQVKAQVEAQVTRKVPQYVLDLAEVAEDPSGNGGAGGGQWLENMRAAAATGGDASGGAGGKAKERKRSRKQNRRTRRRKN